MANSVVNTSYKQDYTVVKVFQDGVILRPRDESALATYWRELVHVYYDDPENHVIHVYVTHIPKEVTTVDAYVDYVIEYPRVEIHIEDKVIDVSDRVACNYPNPETPGLYALDFTLSVGGGKSVPVWRSWVSIDEPPVLRQIITPWNRQSRPVVDLNRLVIEPQFHEALYEAGVPVYNFQQANAPAAVSQYNALSYKDSRVFVKGKRLFISGPKLPVGTKVSVNGIERILGIGVMCSPFHSSGLYRLGEVVSYGGYDYYALMDIPKTDSDGSVIPDTIYEVDGVPVTYWVRGAYYTVDDIDLEDGEYSLDYLWAVLDVGGYLFKMDLLRAFPVHHYWGYYNSKYFYDYAPGDLVSIISDNVISIYQRNDTSIDEKDLEEAYRPGHYKNPHWTEVYSASNNDNLRIPAIMPYTNSANAIVSKTCSVREEAFKIYARLVGMPMEIVEAIGTKKSVLLWALLYRTRETFPGIRAAMRAIGMDIPDLHRECPSVIYSKYGYDIDNVYSEIESVKTLARSIEADKLWTGDGNPDLSVSDLRNSLVGVPWIRYSREGENPDSVWSFNEESGTWVEFYSFRHIGSDSNPSMYDFSVNNRYYKATVNLLNRLAKDCVVDLGDDRQWVDHNHVGSISEALVALLDYEIPIYIYFRLKIQLASVGHASVVGTSKGVALWDAWGGPIGLKLFPGSYFDFIRLAVETYYPTLYYSYEKIAYNSPDWVECTDYSNELGFRYYSFERAVYLKVEYSQSSRGITYKAKDKPYWISQYTMGCLGYDASTGTGDYDDSDPENPRGFKDATLMDNGSVLYLCKGTVALTLCIKPSSLSASAEALLWQYVMHDGDGEWTMDGVTPFADWGTLEDVSFTGYWSGDAESFKNAVSYVTTEDGNVVPSAWDSDEPLLSIGGTSSRIYYLWNGQGSILGMLNIGYMDRMVLNVGAGEYLLKVTFSEN